MLILKFLQKKIDKFVLSNKSKDGGKSMSKQIVILGAGYGGLLSALTLRKYLNSTEAKVTVVNQYPTHQIITELHRLAGGTMHLKDP